MRDRRVVLVTPRDSYRTGAFLAAAEDARCRVTVVTDAAVTLAGAAVVVDLDDPSSADRVVAALDGRPDGIVGTDGPALPLAAQLARHFDLIGSSPEAVIAAGDKLAQRRALAAAGVRQPRWAVEGRTGGALVEAGPVVVKPVDRAGGQGVVRAEGRAGVDDAVRRVRRLVGPGAPVLVEQFVAGEEVAVDGLLVGGRLRPIALFDKPGASSGPCFAETMLVRPARLGAAVAERVLEMVSAAADAIGLTEGPVHAEVIVEPDGDVTFIELAPRSIGGRCGRILRPAGRSLEEVLIGAALGADLPADLGAAGPATGVHMLPVPEAGVLEEVTGVADALAVPGITGVEITVPAGTAVVPLPEGDRYLGFVFAEGPDGDAVERSLRAAVGCLAVRIDPSR